MNNIETYLDWRGDLSFKASPFNPVDNLIFSVFAYLPFDGLVPGFTKKQGLALGEVAEIFAQLSAKERRERGWSERIERHISFFRRAAKTNRFSDVRILGYQNHFDQEAETQFAAVTFTLTDGSNFIAFRGTDATVAGWKEDFNMSFMTPVPAQQLALLYLDKAANSLYGKLRIGGHSKGGNLAVYAATFSGFWTKRRITAVYNNDGPGFDKPIIAKKGFRELEGRLFAYVPQSSIIGMLLEHSEQYTIVQSTQRGIAQHDPYSWVVLGPDFVCVDTVSDTSRFIDTTIKEWLGALSPEERQRFVDALFDIIEAADISNFRDLSTNWIQRVRAMGTAISNLDNESRSMLIKTAGLLFDTLKENVRLLLPTGERNGEKTKPISKLEEE
ncbi:DUF2974 domain-containing protein [Gracilinema caldarium]|uniref:DUF2974 domain-containing protein n=1 Tax=Gracilinema caldarium TaxID=215591 RepID=UPI0026EFAD67|nr:DUF2974 domain-containing protein [Gracilinema caldarium]